MRQLVVERPGGPEAFQLRDVATPTPADDEYLIEIAFAGVNFADIIAREGYYEAARGRFPLVLGFDFSGTVVGVGASAKGFALGAQVFGFSLFGAYATHLCVKGHQLRPLPACLTLAAAATLPTIHFTAFYALRYAARVVAGERVLIHAAAGGVGGALVQQALHLGCDVVGVVGHPDKLKAVPQAGNVQAVVGGKQLWTTLDSLAPEGFDAVFDAQGLHTLRAGFKRLRRGGRLVVYGFAELFPRHTRPNWLGLAFNWLKMPRFLPFDFTARNLSLVGFNLAFMTDQHALVQEAFAFLTDGLQAGAITPPPFRIYPAHQVAEAHRHLASGQSVGKILLAFNTAAL